MSPTSESHVPKSTSESDTPGEYPPLFSSPGSGILTDDISLDLSSPPPLPPASAEGIKTQSDVDDHVTSLKAKRRRRGVRPSPVALRCPECGRVCRRPHVLSEHIKSVHLELR
ncbi:hypothetical protein FRC06_009226, partial [Ceratobasidium sp. 370]